MDRHRSKTRTERWRRQLHAALRALYFRDVHIQNGERLPADGAGVFACLHRNGAVDGFVYRGAIPQARFLISMQLRRSLLGRVFFGGIEVARAQDRRRFGLGAGAIRETLRRCAEHAAGGGALGVFPEGTSDLGPRHLPFQGGAARIWGEAAAISPGTPLIPMGIAYECPPAFRSRAGIAVGAPLLAGPGEDAKALHARMTAALEALGANFRDAEHQGSARVAARLAARLGGASFFEAQKRMERPLPPDLARRWGALEEQIAAARPAMCEGAPAFSRQCAWVCALEFACIGPVVGAALALNAPPALAGWLAGRRLADGRNVIALWRLLVGAPVLALWAAGVCGGVLLLGAPWIALAYVGLTWLGWRGWHRARLLPAALLNALRRPRLRRDAIAFAQDLTKELSHGP